MMFTIVYLSSKLGQISGRGLFHVIRDFYPRWLLWVVLIGVEGQDHTIDSENGQDVAARYESSGRH